MTRAAMVAAEEANTMQVPTSMIFFCSLRARGENSRWWRRRAWLRFGFSLGFGFGLGYGFGLGLGLRLGWRRRASASEKTSQKRSIEKSACLVRGRVQG